MAKNDWGDEPASDTSATRVESGSDWGDKPVEARDLPAGVTASTAGAGRGSINPPTVADMGEDLSRPSFRMAAAKTAAPAPRVAPRTSVLEGVDIPEPQFNAAQADRLSRRDYAERTPTVDDPRNSAPSMTETPAARPAPHTSGSLAKDLLVNAQLGGAKTLTGVASTVADVVGAHDTADSLDQTRRNLEAEQKENGGDTIPGKAADLVGSIAPALLVPAGRAAQLVSNAGLFAVPAFRDTLKSQLEQGRSFPLALAHASEAFGINLFLPTVATRGSGAVAKAIGAEGAKGAAGAVTALGQAAGEGAAFSVANSVIDKGTDAIAGQQNDRDWIDLKDAASQALGFSVLRGAHMVPQAASAVNDRVGSTSRQFGRALGQDVDAAQFDPNYVPGVQLNPNLANAAAPAAPGSPPAAAPAPAPAAPEAAPAEAVGAPGKPDANDQLLNIVGATDPDRIKALRAAGETAVADELQRRSDTLSADRELQAMQGLPFAGPEFGNYYRGLRSDGVKPAEAASRAGMLGTFAQHAQQAGITPKAVEAATQKALKMPLAQVPQFLDRYAASLARGGIGTELPQQQLATAVTAAGDQAMHTALASYEPKADAAPAPKAEPVPETGGAAAAPAPGFDTGGDIAVTPEADAAHQAATSPLNDRPEPTQAMKDAGNYAMGHIKVGPLDVSVENPQGSTRRGVGADGTSWETLMRDHYGYIKGTVGADKDHLDVFVKPGTPESYRGPVFVVDQVDPSTGKFDEAKVVVGAGDRGEAEQVYRRNYGADWQGLGAITELPMPAFEAWARSKKTKEPIGDLSHIQPVEPAERPAAAAPAEAPDHERPQAETAATRARPVGEAADHTGAAPAADVASQPAAPSLTWEPRPSGTLAVKGDDAAIREKLKAIPAKSLMVMQGGIMVGRTQAARAQAILEGKTEAAKPHPLSVGTAPGSVEAVTVRDGVIHIGKHEALNFDTGEPIKAPADASSEDLKRLLKDAGALSSRQKFFGGDAAPAAPQPVEAPARYGRDGTPLDEGGKPFKTEQAARDARKLQTHLRVVRVDGGFALADKSAAQLLAETKAAARLRSPSTSPVGEPIPAHSFIAAEGGLRREEMADSGFDRNVQVGNRKLFAAAGKGLSIERTTEKLIEAGYLPAGSGHNEAYDLIRRSVTSPQYTPEGWERIGKAERATRFADHLAAQKEQPSELTDFLPDELEASGYERASPDVQAEVRALLDLAGAKGIDAETLLEDVARINENATEQTYYEHAKQALESALATQRAGEGDRGQAAGQEGAAPGAEAQGLTRPSREDVLQQQQRREEGERTEAQRRRDQESRARADAERGDFTLTGSDRPADVAAAGGQQDLLSAQRRGVDLAEGPPLTTNEVRAAVLKIAAHWENGPEVHVVLSAKDLPGENDANVRGLYTRDRGVWVVAGLNRSRTALAKTLAHEAVGHYGLRNMLGREHWDRYMENIQRGADAGDKTLMALRDEVRKLYDLPRAAEADEIAALAVEKAVGPDGQFRPGYGFAKAVYARVAQFLRELGINVRFTNAELQGMLVRAQEHLKAGERTAGASRLAVAAARENETAQARTAKNIGGTDPLRQLTFQGYEKAEVPRVQAAHRLNMLLARRDAGKISEGRFEIELRMLAEKMAQVSDTKAANRILGERERGADLVREKLIRARRQGEVDPQTTEFALWALDKNPALADGLGLSVRTAKEGQSAGQYNPTARVATLFKNKANEGTAVHEILHHAERMMPADVQAGITNEWARSFAAAVKKATPEQRAALDRMLQALAGDTKAQGAVHDAFKAGTLAYDEHYQLTNPSEFWAVNATRIMQGRFEAGSWIGKARQWVGELVEKARGIFGLASDAPVLRGLRAVLDGEGTFVSKKMLSEAITLHDVPHAPTAAGADGAGKDDRAEPNPREKKPYDGPGAELVHSTRDAIGRMVEDGLLKVAPMGKGSDAARAVAKDYANAERLARYKWHRFDDVLVKNFTEAERRQMWEAADEQNVLMQEGKDTTGKGLDRLNPQQRKVMDTLHAYGEALLQRAKDVGMFHGEGLPYWTPRMAVMIGENGEYRRPSEGQTTTDEGRGFNVTKSSGNLKQRKYLTAAETEAAMKAKLGDGAQLVRDIRTMPMAMARLERAIAGRELVNQIKALGQGTAVETTSTREGPNFFTVNHPAFKTFVPRQVPFRMSEYFDRKLMDGLSQLAENLGITHERKGALKGRALGLAYRDKPLVQTKFFTPEQVLTHELGHQIDFKYGLTEQLTKRGATAKELRALADLRIEGQEGEASDHYKAYLRKGTEKIANLVHAYVHNPERFREVAPETFKWFDAFVEKTPELAPLRELGPSLTLGSRAVEGKITQWEERPIYISRDFEGPLKAILSEQSGELYKQFMSLKSKSMGLIMYSPLIHNAVEWGRALPIMPGKVLTFRVYFQGNRLKNDPLQMAQAIKDGLVPIGHRGAIQDITGIAEDPTLAPGRSWTAKLLSAALSAPVRPVSKDGARAVSTAVRKGVDAAGDFWHNTLLWDRVGDLQAGLYGSMREDLVRRGFDEQTAGRLAAHFANRYAGALPNEAMSANARKIANFVLFSRSFTLGNLGVIKDMTNGFPRDVAAQIERDAGEAMLGTARSVARRKAIAAFALDMALMYAGNALLQSALDKLKRDKTWDEITQGYVDRFHELVQRTKESPLDVITSPLASLASLTPNSRNEPGKEDRILYGTDETGTNIYLRSPVGKVGEEFKNWISSPLETILRKQGTVMRPLTQTVENDKGFGQRVYNPDDRTWQGMAKNIGRVAWLFMSQQLPADAVQASVDWTQGVADDTDKMKLLGPLAGVTFSKGAPGGPEVGEMYHEKKVYQGEVADVMPDVRRAIKTGDTQKAIDLMLGAKMDDAEIKRVLNHQLDPSSRLSEKALDSYYRRADEESQRRMEGYGR